jgi:hypothetical protein
VLYPLSYEGAEERVGKSRNQPGREAGAASALGAATAVAETRA